MVIKIPMSTNIACRSKNYLSLNWSCKQKSKIFRKLMDNKDIYNTTNMNEGKNYYQLQAIMVRI